MSLFILALVIFLVSAFTTAVFLDSNNGLAFGISVTVSVAALMAAVLTGGVAARVHFETKACDAYSVATERDVQFVRYHTFDWDCLVQTSDGWVARDQIRKVED